MKTFKEHLNERRNAGIPNIPLSAWELTGEEEEEGSLAICKWKGKYYATTAIIEPGSVDKIIDIIDYNTEEITKAVYNSLE